MKLLSPTYILTPEHLLENYSIVFEETILEVAPTQEIRQRYPEVKEIELLPQSIVMPGLINPHVHLEFSANVNTLAYGSFVPWLYSVIENREALINGCEDDCIDKAITSMLQSGITTIGAISSYGFDLEPLVKSSMRTLYFNEIIGSNPSMADALWQDFQARVNESLRYNSTTFQSAIAIHSPYSVHPILATKAIAMAQEYKMPLTAHFMESPAEREWLDKAEGAFKPFFNDFLGQKAPFTTPEGFLRLFDGYPTLFTHAVHLNDSEAALLQTNHHTLIHAPVSNRLLGNGKLDIERLNFLCIPWILGTDGLSSHYALDLFEEMKIALFMHHHQELTPFALALLEHATSLSAKALGLNSGKIEAGRLSDMVVIQTQFQPKNAQDAALHLLLQPRQITHTIINGEIAYAMD